ncbi:MAG: transglutaminase-like cysteine peptidase [Desulfovibrionaceae bacterium]
MKIKHSIIILLLIIGYYSSLPILSYANNSIQDKLFNDLLKKHTQKRPLTLLPKWTDTLERIENGFGLYNTSLVSSYTWSHIKRKWQNLSKKEKLLRVNALFNVFPYITDTKLYNVEDYWAAPKEFLQQSGDCEDYAIIKFYALQDLGFKVEDMRILVLIDTLRNIGHAVLIVNFENELLLLDNTTELVLPAKLYTHYEPKFTINTEGLYL